jgi:hypothetical protein
MMDWTYSSDKGNKTLLQNSVAESFGKVTFWTENMWEDSIKVKVGCEDMNWN